MVEWKRWYTKLSAAQVTEIRAACKAGADPAEIARQLGVKVRTIRRVVARQSWRHVP